MKAPLRDEHWDNSAQTLFSFPSGRKFEEESLAFDTAKVWWPLDGNEEAVYSLW